MAKIATVESMAIVVPVIDHWGLDTIEDYIPCEPQFAVGYVVYEWDVDRGTFGFRQPGFFEDLEEAEKEAERVHERLCAAHEINP